MALVVKSLPSKEAVWADAQGRLVLDFSRISGSRTSRPYSFTLAQDVLGSIAAINGNKPKSMEFEAPTYLLDIWFEKRYLATRPSRVADDGRVQYEVDAPVVRVGCLFCPGL